VADATVLLDWAFISTDLSAIAVLFMLACGEAATPFVEVFNQSIAPIVGLTIESDGTITKIQ
jgi:hypothetical protein